MNDLQFVIQQHTTPDGVHWDLMLEHERVLWTWRLAIPPEQIGPTPLDAERIADHPRRFLDYQGPVQNGTGRVQISEKGSLQWQSISPAQLICQLGGDILKGLYCLRLDDDPHWILTRQC